MLAGRPGYHFTGIGPFGHAEDPAGGEVRLHQRIEHPAVDLDQHRVGTGPGQSGMELTIDQPELLEVVGAGRMARSSTSLRSRAVARDAASSNRHNSRTRRDSSSARIAFLRPSASGTSAPGSLLDDKRPVAAPLDDADGDQRLHRLTHRGPGHAELLGQGALGGELRPRLQFAAGDPGLDVVAHLLGQAWSAPPAQRDATTS